MQRLPLHPRLARVLIAAHGSFEGCAACAQLSEPLAGRAIIATSSKTSPKPRRASSAIAIALTLVTAELRRALLAGYPDRVAKRRDRESVTMASGHGAVIAKDSGRTRPTG